MEVRILFTMKPRHFPSGVRRLLCGALAAALIIPAGSQQPAAIAAGRQERSPAGAPAGVHAKGHGPLNSYTQTMPGSVVQIRMVAMPAGSLTSGGRSVPVKPFWIASTETTWEAFDTFLASGTPSVAYDQTDYPPDAIARPSKSYILPDLGWGHHGYPVINVSSLSVTMFCRWLSAQTGRKYRLPTEAEWEYACRAGSLASRPLSPPALDKLAWYAGNSDRKTHPVAKKRPNAWGLYDMLGNVGEWATDSEGKPVLCGGVFKDGPNRVLPTMRRRFSPAWQATDPQLPKSRWWLADGNFVGFRIVCEP